MAVANDAFQPDAREIENALKVEAAAADAQARGLGAYLVDGRMIDLPFVLRAQAVLASARALGLVAGQARADGSPVRTGGEAG